MSRNPPIHPLPIVSHTERAGDGERVIWQHISVKFPESDTARIGQFKRDMLEHCGFPDPAKHDPEVDGSPWKMSTDDGVVTFFLASRGKLEPDETAALGHELLRAGNTAAIVAIAEKNQGRHTVVMSSSPAAASRSPGRPN